MSDKQLTPQDKDFVNSLANGLEVILAFDGGHQQMTLSDVADRTGMDRAKSRRFLMTLEALGYVRKNARLFELTPKVLELGYSYHAAGDHQPIIQHHLNVITEQLGESSSMAQLDNQDVIYVLRSPASHRLMSINLNIGTRLPAAYTSMGRVLLAQLPEGELEKWLQQCELSSHTALSITSKDALRACIQHTEEQGYCILDQELDMGLRSIAVPVFSRENQLIGAINISTNASRVTTQQLLDTALPLLQSTANTIQRHA